MFAEQPGRAPAQRLAEQGGLFADVRERHDERGLGRRLEAPEGRRAAISSSAVIRGAPENRARNGAIAAAKSWVVRA